MPHLSQSTLPLKPCKQHGPQLLQPRFSLCSPSMRCITTKCPVYAAEVAQPGPEQLAYTNSRRTILLDDGLGVSDPKPARYPAPGASLSSPDASVQSTVLLPA
jgi:hypothetical protein